METGIPPGAVKIDLCMSVIKEFGWKLLVSAYDHIRSHADIIRNGFRKAGITSILENGLSDSQAMEDFENDPFVSSNED